MSSSAIHEHQVHTFLASLFGEDLHAKRVLSLSLATTLLQQVGFEYVVRFRQCITVTTTHGERRAAADWVPKAGHLRKLPQALVTADRTQVGAVVCVKKKGMTEPWCLATSLQSASGAEVVALYSRCFSIEEGFRDLKDLKFGMGLSWVRIAEPERRDRLLLLSALACALLTLWAPQVKAWAWNGTSRPTPSSVAPTRSSARAACITKPSPTCPSTACALWWSGSPSSSASSLSSASVSGFYEEMPQMGDPQSVM